MFDRTHAHCSANRRRGNGSPEVTSLESTPNFARERESGSSAASRRPSIACRVPIASYERTPGAISFMTALYSTGPHRQEVVVHQRANQGLSARRDRGHAALPVAAGQDARECFRRGRGLAEQEALHGLRGDVGDTPRISL